MFTQLSFPDQRPSVADVRQLMKIFLERLLLELITVWNLTINPGCWEKMEKYTRFIIKCCIIWLSTNHHLTKGNSYLFNIIKHIFNIVCYVYVYIYNYIQYSKLLTLVIQLLPQEPNAGKWLYCP